MPECVRDAPDMHLVADPSFDMDHAFIMLWAVWLAERPQRWDIADELQARGFDDIQLIGRGMRGAYAYIADTEDLRMLVFRGSQNIKEWVRDALFFQSDAAEIGLPGAIHHGMKLHYQELEGDILSYFEDPSLEPKPLVVAGHSLGSAMALLYALTLEKLNHDVKVVYVSGPPRVGNEDFFAYADQQLGDHIYELEMAKDLSPMVPPTKRSAAAFAKLLPEKLARLRNKLADFVEELNYANPDWPTVKIDGEKIAARRYGLVREIGYWDLLRSDLAAVQSIQDLWSTLQARAKDHSPERYLCEYLNARRRTKSSQ